MKRLLACILGIVIALGIVLALSLADPGESQDDAFLAADASDDVVVGDVDVAFDAKTQQSLYDAIVEQLRNQGLACDTDDSALRVTMPAASNAAFTTLDASQRNITNIAGLEQFTGLVWIDLSNNLVQTSIQFAGLKRLVHVDLYDNKVRDLSGFSGLSKLRYLNLGDNNERSSTTMTGLEALDTLTQLREFDFSRNETPQVTSHLKDLTSLMDLNLMGNSINDVYDLAKLTNMRRLNLNSNPIAGVASLAGMTDLEELLLANCYLYATNKSGCEDKTGIDALFDDQGNLLMTKLKKLDVMCIWGSGLGSKGTRSHEHFNTLYQLFKDGQLELGFHYTWTDDPDTPSLQKTDGDVHYVTYDAFYPYCDGVHDDYYAISNAHQYANKYGCEVRATEGDSNAASGHAAFHIFKYYDTNDLVAYTNVDWQNANVVIHDEHIDKYPGRFKEIMHMYPSPGGSTKSTSVSARKKTISNSDGSPVAINAGKSLNRMTTSIQGLSNQVDAAILELADLGYERFYVETTNANYKMYRRYDASRNETGRNQWDGFIVDRHGNIERLSSAKLAASGTYGSSASGSTCI